MSLKDETAEPAPKQDWLKMYPCEEVGTAFTSAFDVWLKLV